MILSVKATKLSEYEAFTFLITVVSLIYPLWPRNLATRLIFTELHDSTNENDSPGL